MVISVVFSFFFGIFVELLQQYFTTTRAAEILDIVANLLGALLAIGAVVMLNKLTGIINKI